MKLVEFSLLNIRESSQNQHKFHQEEVFISIPGFVVPGYKFLEGSRLTLCILIKYYFINESAASKGCPNPGDRDDSKVENGRATLFHLRI